MTALQPRCPGALIVGGAHGALAVARSLGRRGIPVFFLTHDNLIAKFSRYVTGSAIWAGPEQPDAAGTLLKVGRDDRLEGCVLLPCGDSEVELIAKNHAVLSEFFRVTTPDWETSKWALDKRLTYQRAASLGIGYPRSFYPRSGRDLADLNCRFPVVLKPTSRHSANAFTLQKAWQADDLATLTRRYDQASALVGADGIVLQEMIPGGGERQYSYAAVWKHGRPVASLVARRARQYPIHFGFTSTLVQSVECPEVEEAGTRFLQSLDYHGLAEVEFKYDVADARYKILDVNARPWTWIGLGAAAGADFPYILWQLAAGLPVAPVRGRSGVAWMHVSRDMVAACQEMMAGCSSPAAYLKSLHRPTTFAAFAADDLVPGMMDLPLLGWRLITRRLP
ncbi:MAG TPA: hypothetical protein VFX37_01100, partial [Pseudolabrys sp.]|nr:hypothetical protein [Pseudolabrys sp.]